MSTQEAIKTIERNLDVTPIPGERFVFTVESATGSDPHRVDLEVGEMAIGNLTIINGQCSCHHFVMRSGPKIRAGEAFRCKHIQAARDFLLDCILADYLKKNPIHRNCDA